MSVSKRYRDRRPVVARVYRWGFFRWRGYLGSDRKGVSYGLCPSNHLFWLTAQRCAARMVKAYVSGP